MENIRARYGSQPMSLSHAPAAQRYLDLEWKVFTQYDPGPWLLADGMAVLGLRLGLSSGSLMFQWRTAFHPKARWPSPEERISVLGFFGEYDLYALDRKGRPPSLVARWGVGTDAFTHDLDAASPKKQGRHKAALDEAQRRANLANMLWGSKYAQPAFLGAIAMPVRALPL